MVAHFSGAHAMLLRAQRSRRHACSIAAWHAVWWMVGRFRPRYIDRSRNVSRNRSFRATVLYLYIASSHNSWVKIFVKIFASVLAFVMLALRPLAVPSFDILTFLELFPGTEALGLQFYTST